MNNKDNEEIIIPPLSQDAPEQDTVAQEPPAPKKKRSVLRTLGGIVVFLVFFGAILVGGYFVMGEYTSFLKRDIRMMARTVEQISTGSSKKSGFAGDSIILNLYFPVDGALQLQERTVPKEVSVLGIAEVTLSEFLSGPGGKLAPLIPKGAEVKGVYYGSDKVLYLDFSQEMKRNFTGDAMGEFLLLRALYESMMANVYDVEGIKILVEGQEIDSLGGHISVQRLLDDAVSDSRRVSNDG
jgi:hypothetical protein